MLPTILDIPQIVAMDAIQLKDLAKALILAGGRNIKQAFLDSITEVRALTYEGSLDTATAGNRDLVTSGAWKTGTSLQFSFARGANGQYAAGAPHTGNIFVATHIGFSVGLLASSGAVPTELAYQLAASSGVMVSQSLPANTQRLAQADMPLGGLLSSLMGQQGVPSDAVFQTANISRGITAYGQAGLLQLPFPIVLEPQALWNLTIAPLIGTPTAGVLPVHPTVFGLDIGGPTNLNS